MSCSAGCSWLLDRHNPVVSLVICLSGVVILPDGEMSVETDGDGRWVLAGDGDEDGTALLAEFRTWLSRERGLSPVSVRCYVRQARVFLPGVPGVPEEAVRGLDAGQVTAFVTGYCRDRNPWRRRW
jgi:hypothetical protein